VLALALTAGFSGCGSSGAPVSSPASKPTATASAAAPTATAAADNGPAFVTHVDFLEAKLSAAPDKPIRVDLDSPAQEQVVAAHFAQDFKIRYSVSNFDKLPEGSYVQLVLDNVPFRPIKDLKEPIKLRDLVEGGQIAEGEHILAVYVARKNQEAVRSERGVGVSRFWVGKKNGDTWKPSKDPLLVVGSPSGTYEGADELIADYYLINAGLGAKDYSLRVVLKGPGIKDADGDSRVVTDWVPLLVLSPGEGTYTLEVSLIDSQGQPARGPWSTVARKATIKAKKK